MAGHLVQRNFPYLITETLSDYFCFKDYLRYT